MVAGYQRHVVANLGPGVGAGHDRSIRWRTDRAWATSPSASASATTSGPTRASAASSWEWNNAPRRSEPRPHGHAAGPTLWVGVVLLIGGIVAIIAALAVGYEPSELRSLLGMAAR